MIGARVELPRINTGRFSFGGKNSKGKTLEFTPWLKRITPTWTWDWKYLTYIQQHLNKITSGECKRLMLFLPPRHGKSELTTIRYPVFRLRQKPEMRVIIGGYNQILANKFSRKARKIAIQAGVCLSKDRAAVEDWETEAGGGVRAIGVGGGITGQGGDLIVIDDPVKNRKEANSLAYRDMVWDWYTDDLYTRLEPGGAIILIMTRWHEDDLAGRILASEDGPNWTIIKLPAEAEEEDPIGREIGEALCPARYDLTALQRIKTVLGKGYWALYQQRPQEQEGDMFKRSWFDFVEEVPHYAKRVRYWDKAATKDGGDYTAGVLMARVGDFYFVEDVVRGQWASAERDKIILETAHNDAKLYGLLGGVEIWIEQEPGSSGVDSIKAQIAMLSGFSAFADKVTGDKLLRAEPLAAQALAGNVKLKRAPWNASWIDEVTTTPNAPHDDQLDGSSGAFRHLADYGGEQGEYGESPLEGYRG